MHKICTFILSGYKLKGRFSLVKTSRENQWLLIKGSDGFESEDDLTFTRPESVLTGRTNQDLEDGKAHVIFRQDNKSNNTKTTSYD
jgi:hypothetical protein